MRLGCASEVHKVWENRRDIVSGWGIDLVKNLSLRTVVLIFQKSGYCHPEIILSYCKIWDPIAATWEYSWRSMVLKALAKRCSWPQCHLRHIFHFHARFTAWIVINFSDLGFFIIPRYSLVFLILIYLNFSAALFFINNRGDLYVFLMFASLSYQFWLICLNLLEAFLFFYCWHRLT